ncbi:site-specific integrase [Parvibaculum sp.]|uniref:tyrosine-type recombinase/integrase n=1 Tax=Parvibaculum sp. TaxID=2024848 RepID=UPI001D21715D|nr:site-specific integrase [Parvibaculum sp.]MBX3490335.1 site-specific integrase [Parvibaculum sp.]
MPRTKKIDKALQIAAESVAISDLLSQRAERAKLRPTTYFHLVKFIEGDALAYRPRLRGGVWFIKARVDGRYLARLIARADDLEPADGESVLSYAQALEKGRSILSGDKRSFFAPRRMEFLPHTLRVCPIGEVYTVGHALRDYLEEKRNNGSPQGYRTAVADANAYIVGDLSSIPCADLDIKFLKEWFRSLGTRPLEASNFVRRSNNQPIVYNDGEADRKAKVRANCVLITLKAALNLAWRDGRIETDTQWRRLLPYRSVRKARRRILSSNEIEALLKAAPPDLRKLILGGLFTGCRSGELMALRPSNFNYETGTLFVHATKTCRSRNIVLPYEAISYFERLTHTLGEKHPIFHRSNGEPWGHRGYCHLMRKISIEANIEPPVIFHELRHTYASRLIMSGVSPFVVADQLGHADCTQIIKTYGHVSAEFAVDQVRTLFPRIEATAAEVAKTARWHKGLKENPPPRWKRIGRI